MKHASCAFVAAVILLAWSLPAAGQSAVTFDPPDPSSFYQNTTFTIDGDVGFIPSHDADVMWSFRMSTGEILDPDGLVYNGQSASSALFLGDRLAFPGQFNGVWGIRVVDVSDVTNLAEIGVIPTIGVVAGQNIAVDADGVTGYIAAFNNDRLYSFSTMTMSLVDPDGLALPGNPDRIAIAGDRVAMVDTDNGAIMVADVSNPANLGLLGTIPLSPSASFGSNDNIVFADDGRTGFVSSNERVLYSFDVIDLTQLDPNGLAFGTQLYGDHVERHGQTLGCIWSRGLAFVDASNPSDLSLISQAAFGGVVAPQGSATVAFSSDGQRAAIPVVYPGPYVYTFEVATGAQFMPPFRTDDQPNFVTAFGADDRLGVVCSLADTARVWLIEGLLGTPGAVEPGTVSAHSVVLGASAPNPFAQSTTIRYAIPSTGDARGVTLGIYDVHGRLVRHLIERSPGAGWHDATWDGTDTAGRQMPRGVYFFRLRVGGESDTRRVVLVE